jgi:tetratricopeptide (TPR) repeat protein
MAQFELEEASAAFDEVFQLRPDAYLWQAGIVKYYLDDLQTAANIFAKSAIIYESKFGGKASEERIWRHACELKMATLQKATLPKSLKKARIAREDLDEIRSSLEPMPDVDESLMFETRKAVRIAGDLFEASVDNDAGREILSRAKLRSIGGNFDELPRFDIKMWKLNAWYYLGLHYEAIGEEKESKECLKMAIRSAPNTAGNGEDILHVLPVLHMSIRDWFDDDDMDVDPLELLKVSHQSTTNTTRTDNSKLSSSKPKVEDVDPVFFDSIRQNIAKLTITEIQRALQIRGVKSSGHKIELQQRLFESLMTDAGLAQ